jgi:AhpC/TSA family
MIQMILSVILVLTVDPSLTVRDVHGHVFKPFHVDRNAQVLFFLSAECPISRFYAQEIQRICTEYGTRGVRCGLVYEDVPPNIPSLRRHLEEFGYREIPAVADSSGEIARHSGASVTPQAVVIDGSRRIRYRGRIDNFYAALGKPRRQATVHDLKEALDSVLAGRAVRQQETSAIGCFIESFEPFKEKR